MIGAAIMPAKAASAMPKANTRREEQRNVDAEGRGHFPIAVAGANHHAERGSRG